MERFQVISLSQTSARFDTVEKLIKALARPHDRVIDGEELECTFASNSARGEVPALDGVLPDLQRMRRCLQTTGIDHILAREADGWFTERQWEDTLSGGEQQRLCLARVLFHRPTFGLLDECTSMVAADAEQDLYRKTFVEWGITPITMTQRMFMPDF